MQFRRLLSIEETRTCSVLIITHSRKTMEIANRWYGVTMEEPGVSKLIPIQLQ